MSTERWLELLRSYDPTERKQAIKAVAKGKMRAALPQLAAMARDEPDDDIRQLAAKAVYYIRKHTAAEAAAAQAEAETEQDSAPRQGRRQSGRARKLFERAHKLYMQRKKDEAAAMLLKAVQADTDLRGDPGARHLASKIVNQPEDTAIAALQAYVVTHGDEARQARVDRLRRIRVSVVVVVMAALVGVGVALLMVTLGSVIAGLLPEMENLPMPLISALITLAVVLVAGGLVFMLLYGFGRRVSRLGGLVEGVMHGIVGGVLGGLINVPALGGVLAVAVAGVVMLRHRGPTDFQPDDEDTGPKVDPITEAAPLYEVDYGAQG